MLIGKFADKFDIRIDTVRYYMKLGLLLPNKKKHYYYYDDKCIEDMKWIQELKQFKFSLEEINKILALKRVTSLSKKEDINFLIQILKDKRNALQQEAADITEICHAIDEKVTLIGETHLEEVANIGIPFSFLSILYCPYCQALLELDNAKTKGQQIYEGELHCSNCSYYAQINEGIIITKHMNDSFNPFYIYNIEMVKTVESSFVNLSEQANLFVKETLLKESLEDKIVVETNIDTYVFLDKYISELDMNAFYIFTGSTLPMLKMLKENIEKENTHLSALYILNSGLDLPLQYGVIDYFIDSYSFNEYSLFNTTLPMKRLKPYLHTAATVIGCYFQYNENTKTIRNMKRLHPNGNANNLKSNYVNENLQSGDFHLEERKSIGDTTNPGTYIKYHEPGEVAAFYAYKAISN